MTIYKSSTRKVAEPERSLRFSAGFIGGGTTSPGDALLSTVKEEPEPTLTPVSTAVTSKESQKKRVGLFALFDYSTKNERMLMIVGIIMAAIAGLSMPVWLLLLAQSLEVFNQIGSIIAAGGSYTILLDEMYKLIYSFAIVGAISLVSGTTYVALWAYVGEQQTLRIRKKFVSSALRQEMAWFDTSVGDPQELPVLAANALGRIQMALGRSIADTFANLLSAAGCLMVAFGLDAPLALIMLCIMPVIGIAIGVVSCFMRKYSGLALEEFASAGAFASEVLTGIKTIASLRAEMWAVKRYTGHVTEAQNYSVKSQVYSKLASGIMGLLFYVTYTFAFIFGTYQAAERTELEASFRTPFACWFRTDCGIHGSEVMVCIYGVILCAQFMALMNPGLNAINLGRIAAGEIYGVIERTPTIDPKMEGVRLGNEYDGSIEMRNVIFSYPSRPNDVIFSNFNLKIEPGTAIALVGPSGSGKSSCSKLLLKLYDPIGGEIIVGDECLSKINLKWWRQQIGYVSQEPSLFPGSIRSNIAAGKFDGVATDEEVEVAARAASAHDFIMDLPDSYDTFYSGSSIQLSGGQIQRISIARALIRNPKILILDEATSALDTASERMVQDALDKIREERKLTTITVAHRLSTIVHSDKIVVIADGTIQETGTHKELVQEGGIYAGLCDGQGLIADADAGDHTNSVTTSEKDSLSASASLTKSGPTGKDDVEKAIAESDDVGESAVDEETELLVPDTTGVNSRLRQFSKADILYSILGNGGSIVVGALPAAEAILFGSITGNFFIITDADLMRSTNTELSLWFLLLAALSFIGNICMGLGLGVSGSRLTRRMRVLVFDKLMRYPMGWFDYPEHSTGELTTSLEEDSETVSNVTGLSQGQAVQVFSCLTAGLIVTLVYSWQVGLTAIACVPLILGSSFIQSRYAQGEERISDNLISPATLLERAFADIVVLQAYGLQGDVSNQYSVALGSGTKFKKKQAFYSGLAFGLSQFAVFGTFALVFFVGIKLMLSMKLAFTDFFVALLAVMFSCFSAGQSGADFSARKKGLEAAARLFVISDGMMVDNDDDPMSDQGDKPQEINVNGRVVFKNCEFSYPTRPTAKIYYKRGDRDGFSLDIGSRQSVAFTGRSGCGKSTALQLLLRFYRVDSGVVEIDNQDITEMNIGWLRDHIGYVGQMPVLFAGSVRDNIKLGKPDATEEELITAAKSANAHDFALSLSSGYDTEIGVGGALLSGGQRQRVAIARAIIKNPKLLVLDEATAALDNESEKIVQAALDKMQETNPRTTLTVAHRLETVKNCDKIVVLDKGGVQEEGTHLELLAHKGLYHNLWTKQGGGQ
mmetsp:Transcript_13772/g.29973  ORF Transcript_13772/g.29973 Transcript_13772/m.29973 type:complete len:1335 (+) Transcript_13772:61-4065(+)|eukprot:CAMPEP_0172308178 /NCGR_PEP_ID=MMETSP1058-20130122/8862_1 /TAXON_ID=83371 /ORGANISM="Detonula confervacea, Strain CCMP 353" /LENGTH=1334 /DNA_ID=CAMNT_0013020541 /DNA_START=49 /DNA_END=4053 /DNA_ORIENTATION=+